MSVIKALIKLFFGDDAYHILFNVPPVVCGGSV